MVLRLPTPPDQLLKVTAITELHNDENFRLLFINNPIIILDNISMA